jgi:hypothetical protein
MNIRLLLLAGLMQLLMTARKLLFSSDLRLLLSTVYRFSVTVVDRSLTSVVTGLRLLLLTVYRSSVTVVDRSLTTVVTGLRLLLLTGL